MTHYSKGVETRQIILSTSLDLFSKNGYDAASVAEICQQAQVSKGAFYHHFPSKQALFLALMATWLEGVEGALQQAGASAASVPEALENMAGMTGSIFEALESGFPILLEFWRQASRSPEIWRRAVAPYHRYLDFFADLIRKGVEEGSFDEGLDPDATSRLLMAVAMGLLLQASFDPENADWQEITRSGINLILSGLRRIE